MKMKALLTRVYYRLLNKKVVLKAGSFVGRSSIFEGYNAIGKNTIFKGKIGFASNIGDNCQVSANVGRYCSIGEGTKTVFFQHPAKEFVSTHPAFYSLLKQSGFTYVTKQKFSDYVFADTTHQLAVNIGNDVWVGANVTILGGISIGDGAIIGAGAVVTRDVQPYSIVGGVPAKEIRKRFSEDDIIFLQNLKWWDKPKEWIENHAEFFERLDLLKEEISDESL